MKDVLEHYGLGLVELIAVICIVKIVFSCVEPGGVLNNAVAEYMITLCG